MKSTKTNSPTSHLGGTTVPPVDNSFVHIETSQIISGSDNVFISFDRTDIIQITNVPFYYKRFSLLTNDSLKSRGLFRIQFLLADNTWSTR